MNKHSAWAEKGWLATAEYYHFWGNILVNPLHPFLHQQHVVDIGAGNGRIWEEAFRQGLTLKHLKLVDPNLSISSELQFNRHVSFHKQDINETGFHPDADVFFFKQSFHHIYNILGDELFSFLSKKRFITLAMTPSFTWPVSDEFKSFFIPSCLDILASAEKNHKKFIYRNLFAYPVQISRHEWIEMLCAKFVSCLHNRHQKFIEHEVEWAVSNLPEMVYFDDSIECMVFE